MNASFETVLNFFAIIGFIASVLQVVSFVQQKRFEAINKYAIEQIARTEEGKYTEDEILKLRQQRSDLDARISDLGAQIKENIPKQARQAFLEQVANDLTNNIRDLYSRYEKVKEELNLYQATNLNQSLEPLLEESVREQIKLDALRSQKYQKFIINLLAIILLLILSLNLNHVLLLIPKTTIEIPSPGIQEFQLPMRWLVTLCLVFILGAYFCYKFLGYKLIAFCKKLSNWIFIRKWLKHDWRIICMILAYVSIPMEMGLLNLLFSSISDWGTCIKPQEQVFCLNSSNFASRFRYVFAYSLLISVVSLPAVTVFKEVSIKFSRNINCLRNTLTK